ncbi:ribosomal protein L1p/L10e family-domain-containing protein [Naematelia encephala]|uniref:Ribosomal protein L1p/L10e family-domain-containing protein n=1 Tax=Naematelia encephala TaxID=71784 RepID=A0A1Y2APJ0_9TREE|nr:ribosomal protein L1p/L10e family-domain-containing protein [Naematelia encephala]
MSKKATQPTSSKRPIEPLPPTFSTGQAQKAVEALLAHHAKISEERQATELLSREESVWLVVNTKRGSTRKGMKPVRIQLPHPPLPPPPTTSICLITKPPQRTYKDLLSSPEHNIKFINRVVDTDKLRGKWKPFEARRNLARENDLFLCDERVVPSMPGLLGKIFFDAKKQPIPVNLQRKDLKAELGRAISSTYFHPSTGTSHSIRIATPPTSTSTQTVENILAALPSVIALIPEGWENVLSIGIKMSSSALLPVWTSKLSGRFDKPVKDVEMDGEKKDAKGKKRKADTDTDKDKAVVPENKGKEGKKVKAGEQEKVTDKKTKVVEPIKKAKTVEPVGTPSSKAAKIGSKDRKKTSSAGAAGKKLKEGAVGRAK